MKKVVHQAYKFRIYPDQGQIQILHQHFGSCRFVYNHFLNERIEFYQQNKDKKPGLLNPKPKKSLNYHNNALGLTQLKTATDWLKEVNSQSLQQSLKHLDTAYQKFFKAGAGFPRFKSKQDKQSFKIPQHFVFKSSFKKRTQKYSLLKIPKLKSWIKVLEHRALSGKIKYVTISKTPTGQYYAAFTCETVIQKLPSKPNALGIDLGIKDLLITSDGQKVKNPRFLQQKLKRLRYAQRQVSKKHKGSGRRKKHITKLAGIHQKVSNTRKDYLHKISTYLIRENQTICVEDLAVKNMVKNHKLAQAISDVSWGELLRQLEYKAAWYGREILVIDRYFASSKTCSACQYKLDELALSVRKWKCPNCGTVHDRDHNAAINILQAGLAKKYGAMERSPKSKTKGGVASR